MTDNSVNVNILPTNIIGVTPNINASTIDTTISSIIQLEESFSLYPNPAYEAVYLDLKPLEGTEVTLSILNQFGQKIYEKRIEKVVNEPEKVDISNFSNGLYFLQIKGENRKLIGKRLIVNRLY